MAGDKHEKVRQLLREGVPKWAIKERLGVSYSVIQRAECPPDKEAERKAKKRIAERERYHLQKQRREVEQ